MKKILLILLITLINSPAFCQSKADSVEIAKMLNIDKLAKRPDRYFLARYLTARLKKPLVRNMWFCRLTLE
ncbi:hypothetical protein [Mucilaginibacter defluvii]|uniref:hypothetical protein n=1 Tax=Mucilaginibacter defluvii TaxID=1196019 RepID=UPI0031EF8263